MSHCAHAVLVAEPPPAKPTGRPWAWYICEGCGRFFVDSEQSSSAGVSRVQGVSSGGREQSSSAREFRAWDMSVYVDEPMDYGEMVQGQARRYGTVWSHMMADTEEELIAMAVLIGIPARHIQHRGTNRVHFDVIPSKRALAIKHGAKELTIREIIRLRRSPTESEAK